MVARMGERIPSAIVWVEKVVLHVFIWCLIGLTELLADIPKATKTHPTPKGFSKNVSFFSVHSSPTYRLLLMTIDSLV